MTHMPPSTMNSVVIAGLWLVIAGLWLVIAGLWLVIAGLWLVIAGLWLVIADLIRNPCSLSSWIPGQARYDKAVISH